jgi:hypothetical protein
MSIPLRRFEPLAVANVLVVCMCSDCGFGSVVSPLDPSQCTLCPAGTFRGDGLDTCTPCGDNKVSAAGAFQCK